MVVKPFLPGQKSIPCVTIFLKSCIINLLFFSVGLGATLCVCGAQEKRRTIKNSNQGSVSKSSEKKGDLLIQVNELMEKLENDYGPLMLEELQKRLKKTIEDFQEDVSSVLEDAFNKHQLKYENLEKKMLTEHDENKENVPSFISEYQNKQKKIKL